jgi:rhamnosyl/mannosyltransferase
MKKLKILQVTKFYYPYSGGIERVAKDIAEGLKDRIEIEVLACMPRGFGKSEIINNVMVTKASCLGIFYGMPLSLTFPLLLALKSRNVDILHFHLPFPLADSSYLLVGSRRPKVIVTYHSDLIKHNPFLRFYKPLLLSFLKRVDKILVTSPNLLEHSKSLTAFKNKCTVVPLSIDLKEFTLHNKLQKEFDLGIYPGERIVLFVGRLSYYKGLKYLIEAMKNVEAKLLIVGVGALREELLEIVKSLGIKDKVIFLGKISDDKLKYCYQICDLFVLPSVEHSEAFGIVQLEAMAYGKPIINTNLLTGVPYVSIDGETGITVPPKDSKALSEAINRILNSHSLALKFGENALKRVSEHFSREKMLDSIYAVYKDIMT